MSDNAGSPKLTLPHQVEYGAARGALRLFRGLGPVAASNFAGRLARTIGPRLPVSRVAERNLRAAMPDLDAAERRRIVAGVWDSLARTAAEFPHLSSLRETGSGPGYELVGAEHARALAERGGPAIVFTAHIGNWEILPPVLNRLGVPLAFFYRAAANPAVDRMILDLRAEAMGSPVTMFPKGARGARDSYAHLAKGRFLGMLVDQKLNDGIEAPLFGLSAMTAPVLAVFARRFRCPVLPIHAERIGPARFRIICDPLFEAEQTDDKTADILATTTKMNAIIESWVRARPESWLWLHRRWPREVIAAATGPD